METTLPRLLTPQDVALWLTLPTERVVRLARRGLLPSLKLPGGEILFDREELAAWVETLRERRDSSHE